MPDVRPATYRNLTVRGGARETRYRESNVIPLSYGFASKVSKCQVTHYVPWEDDEGFAVDTATDYLGRSTQVSDGTNKYISRFIPWEHPGARDYLFAEHIEMVGDVCKGQDDAGMGKFDEAITTVYLSTLPYEIMTDAQLLTACVALGGTYPDESTLRRYVSFRFQIAARYEAVPGGADSLRWFNNPVGGAGVAGTPVSTRRAQLFTEGDLRIKWWQIPIESVPRTAIANTIGKSLVIDPATTANSLVHNYIKQDPAAARQLVCMQPTIGETYHMANGRRAVDIEYHFKYYPKGANAALHWPSGQYLIVSYANPGGGFPFPPGDIEPLFRPEP